MGKREQRTLLWELVREGWHIIHQEIICCSCIQDPLSSQHL
jgi:hypothetical protein